jgi:hypothetical protein
MFTPRCLPISHPPPPFYQVAYAPEGIGRDDSDGARRPKKIPPETVVELAEHHADDALTERKIDVLRQVAFRARALRDPYSA